MANEPSPEQEPRVAQVEQLDSHMVKTLFELTKEAPEQQISSANSLDTKMVQIFGAASIVIGFLGWSSSSDLVRGRLWVVLLIVFALAFYVGAAILAYEHLRPRTFFRNLSVDRWLSPPYQDLDEDEFRCLVIVDTGRAYENNSEILKKKARYLHYALASTGIEVLLVVVVLIFSRLIFLS